MKEKQFLFLCFIMVFAFLFPGWGEVLETGPLLLIKEGQGLDVYLDGEFQGKTPLFLTGLTVADKTLLIESEELVCEVSLTVRDSIQGITSFSPVLKKHRTLLTIDVAAKGARVFVDGMESGTIPFSEKLVIGPHSLRLELDGYFPLEKEVVLLKNEAFTLEETLEKAFIVSFSPELGAGDRVTFTRDREVLEYNGGESVILPPGKWKMVLAGEDFRPVEEEMDINDHKVITYTPSYYTPQLVINNIHPKAFVYLDGEDVTLAAREGAIAITKGNHTVVVMRKKYLDFSRSFTVSPEKDTVLDVVYLQDMQLLAEGKKTRKTAFIIGGLAALGGGLVLNNDDVAISLSSDYETYSSLKYTSLGLAGGGAVSLLMGLMMKTEA